MKKHNNPAASLYSDCINQSLDPSKILNHYDKIQTTLREKHSNRFPILETCRIDNGRMLRLDSIKSKGQSEKGGFVAFVPAAGASSRYTKPLVQLLQDLDSDNREKSKKSFQELKKISSLFPRPVRIIFEQNIDHPCPETIAKIWQLFEIPKALFPCVRQGDSFLKFKHLEHKVHQHLEGQVFIVPPGQKETFDQHLKDEVDATEKTFKTMFIEQGNQLSTIRFDEHGHPIKENGCLSQVPAGHGALTKLFPQVKEQFPNCHSIFIRNIDNLNGTSKEALEASQQFFQLHETILRNIITIRRMITQGRWLDANKQAFNLIEELSIDRSLDANESNLLRDHGQEIEHLWKLQFLLFQTFVNPSEVENMSSKALLLNLYNRPVNTLGQVPNTGTDVGGSPVIVETMGQKIALCIEVPHATSEDKKTFLENSQKATHFNPVFVAAELKDSPPTQDHPFWVLAQKTWKGKKVFYFEDILYECLGNSRFANPVFVEVPRLLFNPHKSLEDVNYESLSDWGIKEEDLTLF